MYRAYFQQSQCPFLICKNDKYSTIIDANQAFYDLVGYTEAEFATQFQNRFSEIVLEDLNEIFAIISEQLAQGNTIDYEYRIRAKSGATIWIHDIATLDQEQNIFFVTLMDISYKAAKLEELSNANRLDALTSVLNRSAFENELEDKKQLQHQEQALFIIDLDNFKQVNDTYGHQKGDELLVKIASRLSRINREYNISIGRLGGDEFVLYIAGNDIEEEVTKISQRITKKLSMNVNGITVTASCGVVYDKQNILDFTTLYTFADKTMYEVKNNKKNNFKISIIN